MDATANQMPSWIQAGGVVVFACAVLYWLREFKRDIGPMFASIGATLTDVGKTLTEVQTTLAKLLERERARAERLAATDAAARQLHGTRTATPASGIPESWDEDSNTQPIAVAFSPSSPPRAQTSPGAYGPTRPPRGGG